jgi:hypothetical protein
MFFVIAPLPEKSIQGIQDCVFRADATVCVGQLRDVYPRRRLAALLTASSLISPVSRRIVRNVAFAENSGIGLGRFLLSVSLRFC